MYKVLIIGGTGNISTAMTRVLIERGHEVTLLNRGSRQMRGAQCVVADRSDRGAFARMVKALPKFDCVVDMIAYEPEDGRQLIDCFSGRTRQLIFCSTVDTHAKPALRYPVNEDSCRAQDTAFDYAYKKGILEATLEQAAKSGAFQLTILRPAATYNDHSTPLGIAASGLSVMRRLREGQPVIVPGDGTSLWTSTHRDDVGLAFANAVGNEHAYQNAYNIAGDEALAWTTYYDIVRLALGGPTPEFVFIPSSLLARIDPSDRAFAWCPLNFRFSNIFDCSSAARDLAFRYTIPWAEGAKRMVAHWNAQGDIDTATDHLLYDRLIDRYRDLERLLISGIKT